MKKIAFLASLVVLAGCGTISEMMDKKIDYKTEAKNSLPPLEIPPDLTSPARDNRYVIPETGKASATYSGYEADRNAQARAGNTAVLPQVEQMHVERAGSQRWLVVQDQAPEKLWSLVKDFWQENGFLVRVEVPEAGVLETDWAENRAKVPQGFVRDLLGKYVDQIYSTSERDKFRTRLDRTPDGKGTEVYISHRGMKEVYSSPRDTGGSTGQTVWTGRDPDPDLEAEFLRRLMVRLGVQEEKARTIAASGANNQRAEIKKGTDGIELVQVNEPFDRAWRRVGLALDRVGFTVEDRDRQKGLYFVRYADPEGEMAAKDRDKGFLSRLLSFGSKDSTVKAEQYRVQVRQDPSGSQVQVLNKDGGSEGSKTAQRILTLLHEQLR
jgi:outer membrane protein assembly factor BamC